MPGDDFVEVYRAYLAFVRRSMHRLGVRPADLDDAIQDVFIVVRAKLPTFEGRSQISSWIYGICRRVAHARRQKSHVLHEMPIEDPASLDIATEEVTPHDLRGVLLELLDGLPAEQLSVFLAVEIDELSCSAIAERDGIPLGTVYSRLRLARRSLRRSAARVRGRLEIVVEVEQKKK